MSDPYGQQPQDPYAPQPPTPPTNPYAQTPPSSSSPPSTPAYGQPYASPPQYPAQQSASPYGYAQAPAQNSMALVSMILSLVGIVSWITAPVGAILGHIALKQIRQTGESGEGMAKAGIIVGWIITGIGVLCCGGYAVLIAAGVAGGAFNA